MKLHGNSSIVGAHRVNNPVATVADLLLRKRALVTLLLCYLVTLSRKRLFVTLLLCYLVTLSHAQKSPEQLGGVYYAYPVSASTPVANVAVPAGYEPFYISHYGRHGSRWLPNDERYEWVLAQFADTKNLTPLGKNVRRRLQKVWKNARGNGGRLTPLGARQHRGIAERMAQRYPSVFAPDDIRIWARSSTVDRCRQSMLAFTDRLHELHPDVSIDIATHEADMEWLVDNTPEVKALEKRTKRLPHLNPDRFMRSLFKDPSKVFGGESENHESTPALPLLTRRGLGEVRLLSELFTIATDMQDVELPVNLFDLFTPEEMLAVYQANNERMTICNGRLPQSDGIPARAARTLWRNIEYDADYVISRNRHGASLRFGHDTNLYRLLSLLQLSSVSDTSYDHMDEVVPMAANLQMVFFKRKGEVPTDSTVLVLFLHNEKMVSTPLPHREGQGGGSAVATPLPHREGQEGGSFYPWSSIKSYVADRLHRLDHLQQLTALNTMVGTAQANTQTAGLFGKGSEEHGQTLPAVLAPNGQNFWTPQTQDTEQKCIAPYYYPDTLFQGFRNSHWIVGGCTQDYGSFTVAAITGNLRTQPTSRATRFSHDAEVSHPHYYAVTLPDEHLRAELTASSHTAMIRVTPDRTNRPTPQPLPVREGSNISLQYDGQQENQADGVSTPLPHREGLGGGSAAGSLLHILINPNSDEGQGYVCIDTLRQEVYGYNPVHRIYQGWGEPAGFSGHFLLSYNNSQNSRNSQDSQPSQPLRSSTLNLLNRCEASLSPLDPQGRFRSEAEKELIAYGTFSGDSIFPFQTEIRQQPSPSDLTATHHPELARPVGVYLTFLVPDGEQLTLTAASSFTDRDACRRNLEAEAAGKSFEQMQTELADRWIDRLHTIDVEDPDRARVNQFYGALYRASFLPREFSDAGDEPYFTDFSMWDTYRALHPLYNIILPSLSAQMMQSLVTFADRGGWMPIFPCWNSYTAAMIGDHCASVLADAYVKGVLAPEGQGAGLAYRYLRQNAFTSPSEADYKNGKGRRALQSYLKYGYIPMEDHVLDAFHTDEQTSRTLEYAYDDFCVAQLARDFGTPDDYRQLLRRSENWRNVINPATGWADGRHVGGKFENNTDLTHRKSYITEGATCHYSFYVPHDIPALIQAMGGPQRFEEKLDSMFEQGLYWHGNEPCHQIPYLYNYVGRNDKTRRVVSHILATEYNDTPGGLSGNDDAGQMSAWYIFSSLGFYPVCPGTSYYQLSAPTFRRATFNLENGRTFTLEKKPGSQPLPSSEGSGCTLSHSDILRGGTLRF